MIDKMGDISVLCGINGIRVEIALVVVQIKQISAALGVVILASPLRLFGANHFPDVFRYEGAGLDELPGPHPPAPVVVRAENGEQQSTALLHHPVEAIALLAAGTGLVALVNCCAKRHLMENNMGDLIFALNHLFKLLFHYYLL